MAAIPDKQLAAKLSLQLLNGLGQSRLRDVADGCRLGEVHMIANREEVSDLMELHEHLLA